MDETFKETYDKAAVELLELKIKRLGTALALLETAASYFETVPSADVSNTAPFNQFTTALDCRRLADAQFKARGVMEDIFG